MRRAAALLAAALMLPACGGSEPQAPTTSDVTTFETTGGITLEGELFGSGDRGVVLAHMFGSSREAWRPFAEVAAAEGYLVLAFDLRGFGDSGGSPDPAEAPDDVVAAVERIREEGARSVVVIGASYSGTGALVAAARDEVRLDGVATLSAPSRFETLSLPTDVLAAVDEPKFFIAAQDDVAAANAALEFYEVAPGAKRVEVLTGDAHGTELLEGRTSAQVRNLLLGFLDLQS